MQKRTLTYNHTIYACFVGYVVQSIVNNFVPLLFVTLQRQYQIPLEKIAMLITVNFGLQLSIDFLSVFFVDRIGYRASMVLAHGCSAAGFLCLTVLPEILPDPYVGLLISVCVYAVGGGLLEVLVSPIVEACPTQHKAKVMSLLHSFYCWGHVGVVLLSTAFFALFGIENWRILCIVWAVVPVCNGIVLTRVPIRTLQQDGEKGLSLRELASQKIFWLFLVLIFCAGACEHSVGQWASTFAEQGLGVSKAIGDLAGPMSFAIMMGVARVFYGKYGDRIRLEGFMLGSGIACALAYLLIVLVPSPAAGLLGCALTGLSVGILWPGTFSLAASSIRGAGTAMFAFFALAGDLGCGLGPGLVGFVSGQFGDNLRTGILAAVLFPALLVLGLVALCFAGKKRSR